MKVKPVVTDRLTCRHTSFLTELEFASNITFLHGDSGVGKSAVFSFLQELSATDSRVKCLSYLDHRRAYKTQLRLSRGKLFVIDNADVLLDDTLRAFIAQDLNNQYLIIGRNPTGLKLHTDEIRELASETKDGVTRFFLTGPF